MSVLVVLGVLLAGLLVLAWVDGGREEQRPVVQQVTLPLGAAEDAR